MRIALTGIKHSGKSAVAREMAVLTGAPSVDTDDLICETCDVDSPRVLYQRDGAEAFRNAELRVVEQLQEDSGSDIIVATGGGIADNGLALARLRGTFFVVYLAEDASVLYDRIMAGGRPPFLPEAGTYLAFLRLFTRRDRAYRRWANLVYHTGGESVGQVAKGILKNVGNG